MTLIDVWIVALYVDENKSNNNNNNNNNNNLLETILSQPRATPGLLGVAWGLLGEILQAHNLGEIKPLGEILQLYTRDDSVPTLSNPKQPQGYSGLARVLISHFSVVGYEVAGYTAAQLQ